ncbi:hypothetical protein GCM10028807_45740 [Spirosoma daeguense]
MKTSHILLAIILLVTLTGMVATDVLLKQEYQRIDWKNPYQSFVHRPLPGLKHYVIEGTPIGEIMLLRSTDKAEALIEPEQAKFYKTRQQGDTLFVSFTPEFSGYQGTPREDADYEKSKHVVLRIADLKSLRVKDSRLTLTDFGTDTLSITLQNSRLRTNKLGVSKGFSINSSQNSFAVLGTEDQYNLLRAVVQDSSGIQLNNTSIKTFVPNVSPKAEIQLRGDALKWLK